MGNRSSSRRRRSRSGRRRAMEKKLALLARVLQHPHAPRFHPQRVRHRRDGTVEASLHVRAFEACSGQAILPSAEWVEFLHADALEGRIRGHGASGNRYGFGLALIGYALEQMGTPYTPDGEYDLARLSPSQAQTLLRLYRQAREGSH